MGFITQKAKRLVKISPFRKRTITGGKERPRGKVMMVAERSNENLSLWG